MNEKVEVKNVSTTVSIDEIIRLRENLSLKDQTIGSQKETIKVLEGQVEDLKEQKNKLADDQKVAVIKEGDKIHVCKSCGYEHKTSSVGRCYNCGSSRIDPVNTTSKVVEYRNMDSIIADIKKEESKKLQVDNIALENNLNKITFEKDKLNNQLTKLGKEQEQSLTDARREVRERYQKENDSLQSKIDELVEELAKLENNKTDEQVEEARKQEIIDLKERITELEQQLNDASRVSFLRKLWNKVTDWSVRIQARKETLEKQERVENISNKYPTEKLNEKDKWWKDHNVTPGFMSSFNGFLL